MSKYILGETQILEKELMHYEHIKLLLQEKQTCLIESNPEKIKQVTFEIEECIAKIKNLEKERYYCHRRINAGGVDWSHVLKSLQVNGYKGGIIVESVSETNRHMPSGAALAEACYRDAMDLFEALIGT